MAGGYHQHFCRNRAIETRLKHGDLFRRQCSLAPRLAPRLALDLASGLALLYSCLAPDPTGTSVCRRPCADWCYGRYYRLPRRLPEHRRPANRGNESVRDCKLGFRQTGLDAAPDHVQGSGSHAFDVLHQVHRLREQRVSGNRSVRFAQLLERQRRWKPAGIPDFQSVRKEHDLHAAIVRIVVMRHGVNDRFGHHLRRDFVRPRRPDSFRRVPMDRLILLSTKSTA